MTFMDTACLLGWAMAMACKWTFKQKISLGNDKNLQRLVQFYVRETPVRDTSAKGIPFSELGWKGGSFNTLQAEMRKSSGFTITADGLGIFVLYPSQRRLFTSLMKLQEMERPRPFRKTAQSQVVKRLLEMTPTQPHTV